MSGFLALPGTTQQNLAKAIPAVALLLFAGHFLYEKASTHLFFVLLVLLLASHSTKLELKIPQDRNSQLFAITLAAFTFVELASSFISSASYLTPLKFTAILLLGFLFLVLTFNRKPLVSDKASLRIYFGIFIPLIVLSVLYLSNFKTINQYFGAGFERHFYNPTAILLSIIVPVVSTATTTTKSDAIFISFALWLAFILLSISETAVLILLAGFALVLLPAALKPLIKYVVVVAMLAMPLIVETAHKLISDTNLGGSYTARLLVDRITIWQSYNTEYGGTFWGVGENVMRRIENPAVVDIDGTFNTTHPHNAFLQAHVELGIAGAVLLSLLVFLLFQRIERSENKYREPMIVCLALCMLSRVATHSLWSTNATLLMFTAVFMSKLFIDFLDRSTDVTTRA